jgi:hypothetical protein
MVEKQKDQCYKVKEIDPEDPPAKPGFKAFKVLGSRFDIPENF